MPAASFRRTGVPSGAILHCSDKGCSTPWGPLLCLLGLGLRRAPAFVPLHVRHPEIKLTGMRFCEQNEVWCPAASPASASCCFLPARLPCMFLALRLQVLPLHPWQADSRCRASRGISAGRHELTALPRKTARLSSHCNIWLPGCPHSL